MQKSDLPYTFHKSNLIEKRAGICTRSLSLISLLNVSFFDVRTMTEICEEKTSLKKVRGDFNNEVMDPEKLLFQSKLT